MINVEIQHVDIDESMIRAIARQAERERRAHIINAEGEQQAAKLLAAAGILGQRPAAMQLRCLNTLAFIAGGKRSTILFPMPVGLTGFLKRAAAKATSCAAAGRRQRSAD